MASIEGIPAARVRKGSPSLIGQRTQMYSYAAPLLRPQGREPHTVWQEPEWPREACVDVHHLARGVRWALAIEGAAALGIYFAWLLWQHLF